MIVIFLERVGERAKDRVRWSWSSLCEGRDITEVVLRSLFEM